LTQSHAKTGIIHKSSFDAVTLEHIRKARLFQGGFYIEMLRPSEDLVPNNGKYVKARVIGWEPMKNMNGQVLSSKWDMKAQYLIYP